MLRCIESQDRGILWENRAWVLSPEISLRGLRIRGLEG